MINKYVKRIDKSISGIFNINKGLNSNISSRIL